MLETILGLLGDYTFQVVALGTGMLGLISGLVGTFLVLRKESLLGDTIGHAALPGIALGFLVVGGRNFIVILLGASLTGILATALIYFMYQHSPIKFDNALSLILSFFFGLGIVLMSYIQGLGNSEQAGLSQFLFGQASAMLRQDVKLLLIIGAIILVLFALFWKSFAVSTFDPTYFKSLNLGGRPVELLLSFIFIVTIVMGLQSVGVILISSLLISPAVSARQWTDRLPLMAGLSSFFGGISGVIGTLISSMWANIPTGPTIILVVNIFLMLSLIFAPQKGLISKKMRFRREQEAWEKGVKS